MNGAHLKSQRSGKQRQFSKFKASLVYRVEVQESQSYAKKPHLKKKKRRRRSQVLSCSLVTSTKPWVSFPEAHKGEEHKVPKYRWRKSQMSKITEKIEK